MYLCMCVCSKTDTQPDLPFITILSTVASQLKHLVMPALCLSEVTSSFFMLFSQAFGNSLVHWYQYYIAMQHVTKFIGYHKVIGRLVMTGWGHKEISTLCHSCRFVCQLKLLKTFSGPSSAFS